MPPGGAGVGVGVGLGIGEGVGLGVGVDVGLGSGDVTVLAARSLTSAGPSGVPRPVWVLAVAPVNGLPGVVPPPQPGIQPPNPPPRASRSRGCCSRACRWG